MKTRLTKTRPHGSLIPHGRLMEPMSVRPPKEASGKSRAGGRPRKAVNVIDILWRRLAGESWRQIARRTGLGQGTVYRAYRKTIDARQSFQKPKAE